MQTGHVASVRCDAADWEATARRGASLWRARATTQLFSAASDGKARPLGWHAPRCRQNQEAHQCNESARQLRCRQSSRGVDPRRGWKPDGARGSNGKWWLLLMGGGWLRFFLTRVRGGQLEGGSRIGLPIAASIGEGKEREVWDEEGAWVAGGGDVLFSAPHRAPATSDDGEREAAAVGDGEQEEPSLPLCSLSLSFRQPPNIPTPRRGITTPSPHSQKRSQTVSIAAQKGALGPLDAAACARAGESPLALPPLFCSLSLLFARAPVCPAPPRPMRRAIDARVGARLCVAGEQGWRARDERASESPRGESVRSGDPLGSSPQPSTALVLSLRARAPSPGLFRANPHGARLNSIARAPSDGQWRPAGASRFRARAPISQQRKDSSPLRRRRFAASPHSPRRLLSPRPPPPQPNPNPQWWSPSATPSTWWTSPTTSRRRSSASPRPSPSRWARRGARTRRR